TTYATLKIGSGQRLDIIFFFFIAKLSISKLSTYPSINTFLSPFSYNKVICCFGLITLYNAIRFLSASTFILKEILIDRILTFEELYVAPSNRANSDVFIVAEGGFKPSTPVIE